MPDFGLILSLKMTMKSENSVNSDQPNIWYVGYDMVIHSSVVKGWNEIFI